jgi:hypothetical protein
MNGHTIQFKTKKESFDYYRCSRATRRRDCDSEQIPRQYLEDLVLVTLQDVILNPTTITTHQAEIERSQTSEDSTKTAERLELVKQMNYVKRRVANVVETLANVGSSNALNNKLISLEAEAAGIQSQIDDLVAVHPLPMLSEEQITAQANHLRELVGSRHEEDLRRILHAIIAKITVEREGRAVRGLVTYFHPPEVLGDSNDGFMSTSRCPHGGSIYRHKYTISLVGILK